MGLTITLEDSDRVRLLHVVADPTNILHRVLPSESDSSFRCLNRVDWYGDTVFNRRQMADVVAEIRRLQVGLLGDEHVLLEQIAELAERGQQEPHLFLKFYGD